MTEPLVDRRLLRRLTPIRDMDANAIEELAGKVHLEELPAGRQLFARGQHDAWVYYLVAGRVVIEGPEGVRRELDQNAPEALEPLAPGTPRPATLTALSPVRYIRIAENLLDVLAGCPVQGLGLEEIHADSPEPDLRLFHRLYHDFMAGDLELPHLPDIALRVREAANDPHADVVRIARIIQSDPVLAARLVQAANSPLYAPRTPISTLRTAVAFLGLEVTRNLVLTYTLRGLFRTESSLLRARMGALWRHSALVAAIAFTLAERTAGLDPDRGMLVGLLHDIGLLPVIDYAGRFPELSADPAQLEIALDRLRVPIGAMLLRQWQFGDEMVDVAANAEDWYRDSSPHPDYVDVIIAAQILAAGEAPLHRNLPSELGDLPAWRKVARGQLVEQPELGEELLRRAHDDVADVLFLST